ncbi:MAG: hypothetical protein QOJ54_878 [Aliidongia sp.]|jgi:hypothetical protein|nr:hypothetical protein [Aliidongia sp.]
MERFGTTWPVYLGLTLTLFGWAAWMTGKALAGNWRPHWHLIPYCMLLAAACRFFDWALFGGDLLSFLGYVLAMETFFPLAGMAFRVTRARRMVVQYPWLYRRAGPFAWRALKQG